MVNLQLAFEQGEINVNDLLVAFQNGDVSAFGVLYGYFPSKLYRAAKRSGLTHEDAEDVVEETFKKVIDRIDQYVPSRAGPSGGEGWIRRTFHHTLLDYVGRARHRHEIAGNGETAELLGLARAIDDVEKEAVLDEWLQTLLAVWETCSPDEQEVIRSRGERGPASNVNKRIATQIVEDFEERYGDSIESLR